MGELTERLERLAVKVRSPDGKIVASARGRYQIHLRLLNGAYRRYAESELGHQLAQTATRLWASYRREYIKIVDEFLANEDLVMDEDPKDALFRDRLEQVVARGVSTQGWVTVRSRALVRWEVELARTTVRKLTEDQFLGEIHSAVADILGDYQAQLIVLTEQVYGIGVPDSLRQGAGVDR